MKRKSVIVTSLAAAGLIALGATAAYAAIPSADGTIHGCYRISNPAKGALTVIDENQTCPSGTAPLSWDSDGPDYEYHQLDLRGPNGELIIPIDPGTTYRWPTMPICPAGSVAISSNWELITLNADGSDAPHGIYIVDQNTPNSSDADTWDFGIRNPMDVTLYIHGTIGVMCSTGDRADLPPRSLR